MTESERIERMLEMMGRRLIYAEWFNNYEEFSKNPEWTDNIDVTVIKGEKAFDPDITRFTHNEYPEAYITSSKSVDLMRYL